MLQPLEGFFLSSNLATQWFLDLQSFFFFHPCGMLKCEHCPIGRTLDFATSSIACLNPTIHEISFPLWDLDLLFEFFCVVFIEMVRHDSQVIWKFGSGSCLPLKANNMVEFPPMCSIFEARSFANILVRPKSLRSWYIIFSKYKYVKILRHV